MEKSNKTLKNSEKAITLISLVVTIIVLLILAGISISMLSGENSILQKATDARDKTEYSKAQEEFNLSYLEAVADKYISNESEMLAKLVASMNSKGYPTEKGSATGETDKVTAITLKDVTGNETSLGTSKTKEIELEFTESAGASNEAPYYVLADGKYYEITKNASGDYELATTATSADIVTGGGTPKTYSVQVSSDNSDAVRVSYNPMTKKITLTSGATTTEIPVTITISYEDEEGTPKFTPTSLATSVSNAITAADIVNQTFATTAAKTEFYQGFYGHVVTNYGKTIDTSLNDEWKIFYAGTMGDETEAHIYLIADSYVKYTSLPSKTTGEAPNTTTYLFKKNTDWKSYFASYQSNPANINDGILPAYSTGVMLGSSYATVANMQNLNYSYYRQNYAGTVQPNMRAVASMLDTNIWSSFMDSNGKAKYAIGGSTVEMLMKSYNESHGTDYGAKASSEAGYQITKTATSDTGWTTSIDSMISTSDTNKLYVSESGTSNAFAYWLASPSSRNTDRVMVVYYNGIGDYYDTNIGFRPLVCLNSDVELERQENGSYLIK